MLARLDRYCEWLLTRRHLILLLAVLVTVVLAVGVSGMPASFSQAEFTVDSPTEEQAAAVSETFEDGPESVTIVVLHDGEVLGQRSLQETMALQAAIRENETIAPTLAADRPTADTGTMFVETYLRERGSFHELDLADKHRTLGTFDDDALQAELPEAVESDIAMVDAATPASALLPTDTEVGPDTDARLVMVFHDQTGDEELVAAQLAIEELTAEHVLTADTFVVGEGLTEQRASDATAGSFLVVGPLTLVVLLGLLAVVFRDPIDVAVSAIGLALVLIWTTGIAGWAGLEPTQLLVAVPLLLLGLALDYGVHVLMRYREASNEGDRDPLRAMVIGLTGVVVAIGATTITTGSGFLSGLVSPVPAIREFGAITAVGIVVAFVVFGVVVPALRLSIDVRWGHDASVSPIGRLRAVDRITKVGVVAATRAPVAVLLVALLITGAGMYGATHVDTTVDRADFYPGDRPNWLSIGDDPDDVGLSLHDQYTILSDRFGIGDGTDRVSLVVWGDVGGAESGNAIEELATAAASADTVREGDAVVLTPIDVADRYAPFAPELEEALAVAEETGEYGPVFDETAAIAPEALAPFVADDGNTGWSAARVVVLTDRGADPAAVTDEFRHIADRIESDADLDVTATGGPIVRADAHAALLSTLIHSFVLTLALTGIVLIVLFRVWSRSATVGLVTVLPVLFALSWVIGIMGLVGVPVTAETAIITGIAIGLGVDYAIHVSVRFRQERRRHGDSNAAITTALRETGGAVAASVATTALTVSLLGLTFVPSLQRFGLLVALVVVAMGAASLLLLPSLLLLHDRWVAGSETS